MKMNKITQRNQLLFALNNNKKKKFLPLPDLWMIVGSIHSKKGPFCVVAKVKGYN